MESIEAEVCAEEGKRDARGRRVLSGERWRGLMEEYDRSGLTQKAFCRREGINFHTFVSWLGRRKRGLPEGKTGGEGSGFRELSLSFGAVERRGLEVVLWDGTVVRGERADEVAALVKLLRNPG